MATLSLSSTSQRNFSLYGVSSRSTTTSKFSAFQPRPAKLSCLLLRSLHRNPLRVSIGGKKEFMAMKGKRRGSGAMCYAAPLSVNSLQWISTISSAVLLLAKGTAVKSFLVPLFLLQAPATVVSWIKGEYGIWAAFLALLVRLFFFIPGELELPLTAFLLVIVAPYQVLKLRGRQEGAIISLVIVAYLAFQHFSRIGSLERSFDRGSIIATLAIVSITALSCLFLF
nr:cold-regulated 413 inner membrane protein 1, chloroplastic-like [Malus domestica]